MEAQVLSKFKGNRVANAVVTLILFSVSILFFPAGNAEASSENQCPTSLTGIWTVTENYATLVDMNGYSMNIPLNWDSTLVNGKGYKFYPCENPNVTFTFQKFTGVNNALSTEQLADAYISRYFNNVEGYHVLDSNYREGTREYFVEATIGDSELETIIHGFIPVMGLTGPELFVTTYSADSHDLFQKYESSAAKIYNSIVPVPQSMLTRIQEMEAEKQQLAAAPGKIIAGAQQEMWDNVLGHLNRQTQLDAEARENQYKYDNCIAGGAYGIHPSC